MDRGRSVSGLEDGLSDPLVPDGVTPAQFALRWILDHDAVSSVIPGGKKPAQVADNAAASELPPVSTEASAEIAAIYDDLAAAHVHQRW